MSNKKPEVDSKNQKKKEETVPEQPKIEFEEDDYFEEFYEGNENQAVEQINFKRWQEEWEDEDLDDHFESQIRHELEVNKN